MYFIYETGISHDKSMLFVCLFTLDTKELVSLMKGHSTAIHTISVHASGRYALSSSSDTAQLWDLDTFQRKRKLNIKEDVGIVKVRYNTFLFFKNFSFYQRSLFLTKWKYISMMERVFFLLSPTVSS